MSAMATIQLAGAPLVARRGSAKKASKANRRAMRCNAATAAEVEGKVICARTVGSDPASLPEPHVRSIVLRVRAYEEGGRISGRGLGTGRGGGKILGLDLGPAGPRAR